MHTPLTTRQRNRLLQLLGPERLLTQAADCWPYGGDNSRLHACPQAVAFAESAEQVQALVQFCQAEQLPLIARGRGTGTTGAVVPTQGGMVLSFERMQAILDIDPANRLARVQPGLTNQALQDALAPLGFFWPPDPTSAAFCTLGGNLAYNSAGPRAVKYGTPRDNTLGLSAVTGSGALITTGVSTTKGVVGYDLTRLIIGSEGTLALITEATLALKPIPEARRSLQALYRDIGSAARAVSAIMAQPLVPCALEFMDAAALRLVRRYRDPGLAPNANALLMIEVDGPAAAMDEAVASIGRAAANEGLLHLEAASDPQSIEALWQTRKALSPSLRRAAPAKINEDLVVPVSRIPELVLGLEQIGQRHGIQIINFGHAGNGNIHVNLLYDPAEPGASERAEACLSDTFDLVLSLQGTLSGEHGVGLVKRDHVRRELDPAGLELMRGIKRLFDPANILNPGKTLPLGL